MRKLHLYVIFICSFFWIPTAWSQYFPTEKIVLQTKLQNDTFPLQHPFSLDLNTLFHYVEQQEEEVPFPLQFRIDDQLLDLEVWRSDLRHPDYQLITSGKGRIQTESQEQLLFLKGHLTTQNGW